MEAGLRMSRSSGCSERQAQERQRAICAVAMGSLTRDLLQLEGAIWRHGRERGTAAAPAG